MACLLTGLVSNSALTAATLLTAPAGGVISAGIGHNLALKSDGTVWEWGGISSIKSKLYATQVSGLTGVVDISASTLNLALKNDGTVWEWGYEGNTNPATYIQIPAQVTGLTGVIAVSAGQYYGLALKSDGTVWAWGQNPTGNLGTGTHLSSTIPVQVPNLTNVIDIIAGSTGTPISLALKKDGTVWGWGAGPYGFGDPIVQNPLTPMPLAALTNVLAVSRGGNHSLVLKNDGTTWAWGLNTHGELGDGTTVSKITSITQVKGLAKPADISAGDSFSLALNSDGTVWAWGVNTLCQLGYSSGPGISGTYYSSLPKLINGLSTVTQISAGSSLGLALKSDGTVWAWGGGWLFNGVNPIGNALGNGTSNSSSVPVQVLIGPGTPLKL